MKALVISDRPEIIENVTPTLKEKGFDIIHYRWIIKALDNIEEIQPDAIVLSAVEYPRHWKTLSGFVQSGIGGNDVKIFLCEATTLSDEDQVKADELGIISFEEAFRQNIDAKTVEETNTSVFVSAIPADSEDDETIDDRLYISVEAALNETCGIIHFCSGKYYEDENLVELEYSIPENSYVKYISLFDGNNVYSFSAAVENISDGITSLKVSQL